MTDHRLIFDAEAQNTGTRTDVTADNFLTPVDQFFTRSHGKIPTIDPKTWRLEVDGLCAKARSFTLQDLRAFPRRTVPATLICAGLRRNEYLLLGPLPGELPWGPQAASTGEWTGVRLRDVIDMVGVAPGVRYVEFTGLDSVERHGHAFGFGGSIDLEKALDGDVILATELNGEPLPPVHGFPMRAVVPGWIGARSVKWLGRITFLAQPSENYFQTQAYRVQHKPDPSKPRDVSAGVALSTISLNAVILDPVPEQQLCAGQLRVRGWALGSAGRPVTAVHVSPNDAHDWVQARITHDGMGYTWTFWEATITLPKPGRHTLVVRASDGVAPPQPAELKDGWNVKGYANNAWHRVAVVAV
ncbi:MAG TPA: sulfite oxidase [Gemmatimonadaceae bacterium]|nr:sulfite oxidase [Gemmatimonadaceae bacterium]